MNTFSEVKVAVLGFFLNICITFGEEEEKTDNYYTCSASPQVKRVLYQASKASPLPLLRGGCAYPIFNNMHSRCEPRMDEKGGVGGNERLKC